jgi:hypothetical protein
MPSDLDTCRICKEQKAPIRMWTWDVCSECHDRFNNEQDKENEDAEEDS